MMENGNKEALAILRAVLSLGRRLRAERPDGAVPLAALGILVTLARSGPMVATRLAAEERLQPQSLTRIVARLEEGGVIARTRSTTDRREIVIELTAKGRGMLADDLGARQRWLEAAMARALSEEERAALNAAVSAMMKLADDGRPED